MKVTSANVARIASSLLKARASGRAKAAAGNAFSQPVFPAKTTPVVAAPIAVISDARSGKEAAKTTAMSAVSQRLPRGKNKK